ncbi:MAG: hypothetical protein QFB86_00310 [Patescibacteria group bacterium]|nr:hypothetical protein [Patescibacteria group bacterium]
MNRDRQRYRAPTKSELRARRGNVYHGCVSEITPLDIGKYTVKRLVKAAPADILDMDELKELDSGAKIIKNYRELPNFGVPLLHPKESRKVMRLFGTLGEFTDELNIATESFNKRLTLPISQVGIDENNYGHFRSCIALYPNRAARKELLGERNHLLGYFGVLGEVKFEPAVTVYGTRNYEDAMAISSTVRSILEMPGNLVVGRAVPTIKY